MLRARSFKRAIWKEGHVHTRNADVDGCAALILHPSQINIDVVNGKKKKSHITITLFLPSSRRTMLGLTKGHQHPGTSSRIDMQVCMPYHQVLLPTKLQPIIQDKKIGD